MKKARNLTIPKPLSVLLISLFPLLGVLAFGLGERYNMPDLASGTQLEASRKTIIVQFLPASSIDCASKSDPTSPTDRVDVFFQYLRINKYDNRAVIRGCNNIDRLLMKDKFGGWVQTNVNLNLDAKANPVWQQACLIDDITVADTVVRPENSSIDARNLKECNYMLKNNVDSGY